MIETLEALLPFIKGLWTLPWIAIGFLLTVFFSYIFGEEKVNKTMKRIGLVLLYVFVPLLLFRILLDVDFQENELIFTVLCFVILFFMYVLAYVFAIVNSKKLNLEGTVKPKYIKTVLTNQGRSSAFVGGAMLAIVEWRVFATIYMIIGAIFLFAIIPFILSHVHKKNMKDKDKTEKIQALPWYLRLFPWYLLSFAIAAALIHGITGITVQSLGDRGTIFQFITQLTIPAALYYVGTGIHPHDLKINQMKKLFTKGRSNPRYSQWIGVRNIFFLTVILTPFLTVLTCVPFLFFEIMPNAWFSVILINSILPITSTNMFLIPYGIDKKVTALSVTWTTLICVPIVVVLITFFRVALP
jgi:hypothetical protein